MPTRKSMARTARKADVGRARRDQIVEAAIAVITSSGLASLSLSKIESLAGMKRGQLTYYFPTKEEILLAVFDRMLATLCDQLTQKLNPKGREGVRDDWECVQTMLQSVLQPKSKFGREFHALQYSFLAQIAHRPDYRKKLADWFAGWRESIADGSRNSAKRGSRPTKNVSGKTASAFVQALVHGLTLQLAADPRAFDRAEMLRLCDNVLAPLFTTPLQKRGKETKA